MCLSSLQSYDSLIRRQDPPGFQELTIQQATSLFLPGAQIAGMGAHSVTE